MISAETYNADYEKAVKFGYNKGIDEFAEKMKAEASINDMIFGFEVKRIVDEIADQLKERD